MTKLNFGCGSRIANGWINIDFHSTDPRVKRVNLLKGFPFPDNHFDVVYSSHVLEHFTRQQALFLLREAHRVLKSGGILRIVVPDLSATCKEYLRILDIPDQNEEKSQLYDWIMLELLDQLVRTQRGGEMAPFINRLMEQGNQKMLDYIQSRTENTRRSTRHDLPWPTKLSKLTLHKVFQKLTYLYLGCVAMLIPKHLKQMVFISTSIGERHRWMYDSYGLKKLCKQAGFADCKLVACNESVIPHFNEDCLDINPDGSPHKNNSIYVEALKNRQTHSA